MPHGLDNEEKREWRRLARTLIAIGGIAPEHRNSLEAYVQSKAELRRVLAYLKTHGRTCVSHSGTEHARPELAHSVALARICHDYERDFGLCPQTRRTNASQKDKAEKPAEKTALSFVKFAPGVRAATA
jgi:P27 family predicted phage terminase small subunit